LFYYKYLAANYFKAVLEFGEFFLTVMLRLKPSWVKPELRGWHGPKFYIFT